MKSVEKMWNKSLIFTSRGLQQIFRGMATRDKQSTIVKTHMIKFKDGSFFMSLIGLSIDNYDWYGTTIFNPIFNHDIFYFVKFFDLGKPRSIQKCTNTKPAIQL